MSNSIVSSLYLSPDFIAFNSAGANKCVCWPRATQLPKIIVNPFLFERVKETSERVCTHTHSHTNLYWGSGQEMEEADTTQQNEEKVGPISDDDHHHNQTSAVYLTFLDFCGR